MGDSTTDFSYDDYIVIAEDELTLGGAVRWIGQASFQYVNTGYNGRSNYSIKCLECLSNDGKCYAEVVFAQKPNDTVLKKVRETFAEGVSIQDTSLTSWVVIRLLGMKSKILDDFNQYWKKDVIFLLGKDQKECYGDRNYLSAISPVFDKMFNGKFAEANKSTIELDDINSVENFNDFLLSISNERISPNPNNVAALTEFADRFQVKFLLNDCEKHLRTCYEVPMFNRLALAGRHNLEELKVFICHGVQRGTWTKMLTEGADQLECLGIQFYMELVKKLDGIIYAQYD